ncbi:UNVERIFIED_CONTAM: hypothetical protein FKN15_078480 [Acipenser sinensis]
MYLMTVNLEERTLRSMFVLGDIKPTQDRPCFQSPLCPFDNPHEFTPCFNHCTPLAQRVHSSIHLRDCTCKLWSDSS